MRTARSVRTLRFTNHHAQTFDVGPGSASDTVEAVPVAVSGIAWLQGWAPPSFRGVPTERQRTESWQSISSTLPPLIAGSTYSKPWEPPFFLRTTKHYSHQTEDWQALAATVPPVDSGISYDFPWIPQYFRSRPAVSDKTEIWQGMPSTVPPQIAGVTYSKSWEPPAFLRATKPHLQSTEFFLPPLAPASASTRSLAFTSASSQYLSRLGSVSLNNQKCTITFWFKRSSTGVLDYFYYFGDDAGIQSFYAGLTTLGQVFFGATSSLGTIFSGTTAATYNDIESWHHFCLAVDTTQAVAEQRNRLYVDGNENTNWFALVNATQNTTMAHAVASTFNIGRYKPVPGTTYLDAEMDDFYYIDGQQLSPTSFITGTPGQAKTYSGTYTGAFDIFLGFENNASITALGADSSGEGNSWTLNNMTTGNSTTDHP